MSTKEDKNTKTKSKKRKIISDYESSSTSLNEDPMCRKEKRSKYKESKNKKTSQKKSVENKKPVTSLQDNKCSDEKSPEKIKEEHKEFINRKKDKDEQIELEIWYYLLHHLEESEKLIALKLLVGINKMKKNWRENFIKNKYVDKKVVDDMKSMIKALQDEQEKNKAEKQKLLQEKNELQKKVLEERKYRIQLAETLANEIEKNNSQSKKQTKEEVSNKVEDKQVSQTITEIDLKKEPSTSKTLSNDSNNNTQVSNVKGDMKKEVDLRDILNSRENGGMRESHMSSTPPPFIRPFPAFVPYPQCAKRAPPNFHDRLCVIIKTSIRYFPEVMRIIETKLKMRIRFNKVISLNDGWKVEFPSLHTKLSFLNRKRLFMNTGLFITNSFWIY